MIDLTNHLEKIQAKAAQQRADVTEAYSVGARVFVRERDGVLGVIAPDPNKPERLRLTRMERADDGPCPVGHTDISDPTDARVVAIILAHGFNRVATSEESEGF